MAASKRGGKKAASKPNGSSRGRMGNPWDQYPELAHLSGEQLERMRRRRRHRGVRYWCFRLQKLTEEDRPLEGPERMPGFIEFWLEQRPVYQIDPSGKRVAVEPIRDRTVGELGGYAMFAKLWDVDEDLDVYLRHSSVWHEWAVRLMRIVPVLGEH